MADKLVELAGIEIIKRIGELFRTVPLLPTAGAGGSPHGPFLLTPPTSPVSSNMLATRLSEVKSPSPALAPLEITISAAMDPRLQLAVLNQRTGKRWLPLASTSGNQVAVVARVDSLEAWTALPDVFTAGTMGRRDDGSWIVTGRVPIKQVETIRRQPSVLSLKASQPVRPMLASTVEAIGCRPDASPPLTAADGGAGAVIGIVDFGCDFAHANLRHKNGKTRLLALWDQSGIATVKSPFGYGRLYGRSEIDEALETAEPYAALDYGPPADSVLASPGSHGTHVMDIAAGNGLGTGQPGIAPKADLVFVEVSVTDVSWTGPKSTTQSFGDSVQLLEAVRFVFDTAGDRPCVCNLSLGTYGGPHDGTSLVEQGLDAIVREKPNRAIVIAAANSQAEGIHAGGAVPPNAAHDLVWKVLAGGELELWYTGGRRLEVTLVGPDGTAFGPVGPADNMAFGSPDSPAIFISNRLDDPNNHDNVVGVWLAEGLPAGDWIVRLRTRDATPVDYHAWIERNDPAQSAFATPVPSHTLGSISTGHDTIVVGSYDAHKPGFPLSTFSSTGPTRDGRKKPEVSAPGQDVVAARSRTRDGVVRKNGTSMAAPAVTGLVALILAEAQRNRASLPIAALRDMLIVHALGDPPPKGNPGWHAGYGFGRAHANSIGAGSIEAGSSGQAAPKKTPRKSAVES